MGYFSKEYVDFFKGLAANNHRDWFQDNKKIYEKEVKAPFQQLILDLLDRTNSKAPLKDCLFRINRDTRFSKDKTPYKLHMGAVISDGGRKNMQVSGYYLHLGVGETHMGGGMYLPDKTNLMRIREAIGANPQKWEKLISDKDFIQFYPDGIKGEKNKILPKEVKSLAEKTDWVFNKQFYYMREYEDEIVLRPDLLDFIMSHFNAGVELNRFFNKATGLA